MSTKTKSAEIASKGIQTASQFANLMSAVMSDLLDGSITPEVGHVVCKAAKNLLDVVEMSHRHGDAKFGNVFVGAPIQARLPESEVADIAPQGKVKCNQCDERVSPRALGEHKSAMHPIAIKTG